MSACVVERVSVCVCVCVLGRQGVFERGENCFSVCVCLYACCCVCMCVSERNRETKSVWKRVGYQGVLTGWQKRDRQRERIVRL